MFGFGKKPKNQPILDQESTEMPKEATSDSAKPAPAAPKPAQREYKESFNWRCEQFFGKNWKYIFYFSVFVMLLLLYEVRSINNRMADLEQTVADNNGKVVLTTTDGRAIKVTKEPLKAEYLKKFAVSTMVASFVNPRSQLTDNFQKPNFNNFADLIKTVPAFSTFIENFIDPKNTQAIGDFRGYLQWLISAVAQDKLPEYISIKDYVIDSYEYTGNRFLAEVSIKVVTQSYILSQDRYVTAPGVIKLIAGGSFDLTLSNDINPYGLRFDNLRITTVTKPQVKG